MKRYWFWDARTYVSDLPELVECPLCKGQDRRNKLCWVCRGEFYISPARAKITKNQPACSVCNGDKVVPAAGAWVMPGDTDPCHHCGQTGVEPIVDHPTRSSPFEDEGMGIGNGDNP